MPESKRGRDRVRRWVDPIAIGSQSTGGGASSQSERVS